MSGTMFGVDSIWETVRPVNLLNILLPGTCRQGQWEVSGLLTKEKRAHLRYESD
jgi:hypothetical protein